MNRVILCVLALAITLCSPIRVLAAETNIGQEPEVMVIEVPCGFEHDGYAIARATTPPSNVWDLSKNDYCGTFSFNTQIYTNNRFSGHEGNIFVYVTPNIDGASSSEVSGFTVEVSLCTEGLIGNVIQHSTAELDIGKAYLLCFTNMNSITKYFLKFSQSSEQEEWTVSGEFTVTKNDPR